MDRDKTIVALFLFFFATGCVWEPMLLVQEREE